MVDWIKKWLYLLVCARIAVDTKYFGTRDNDCIHHMPIHQISSMMLAGNARLHNVYRDICNDELLDSDISYAAYSMFRHE